MDAHFDRFLGEVSGRQSANAERKRSHRPTEDEHPVSNKHHRAGASSSLSRQQIDRLLEQAEIAAEAADHPMSSLDARSLKALVQSVEKKIRKNAMLRAKFADQPEKFMDSEVALADELGQLKLLAAQPKLYHVLIDLDAVPMVLGLFAHENLDIRLEVVSLIAELADADALEIQEEESDAMNKLANALIENKVLPLLVSTLWRLDEHEKKADQTDLNVPKEDEDETFQGKYNAFQIIESFADLVPQRTSQELAENTNLLAYLMVQVQPKRKFTANKLYASEILSIVLQSDSLLQRRFVSPAKLKTTHHEDQDLMDQLLRSIAPYRKKDPEHDEEEEFFENLINSLCSVLLIPEGQLRFRHLEGLELMLRCLQDRKFIHHSALRVLDHALSESQRNCERFVEVGGLKHVFPALMGKGRYKRPKASSLKANSSLEQEEENTLGILASLSQFLDAQSPQDALERFHVKFLEKEFEKVDRLVDLYEKYHRRVSHVRAAQHPGNDASDSAMEEYEAMVDEYRSKRLDVGLFSLQRICLLLAHLCEFSLKARAYTEVKFYERGLEFADLQLVLAEQLEMLGVTEQVEANQVLDQADRKRKRLQVLITVLQQFTPVTDF